MVNLKTRFRTSSRTRKLMVIKMKKRGWKAMRKVNLYTWLMVSLWGWFKLKVRTISTWWTHKGGSTTCKPTSLALQTLKVSKRWEMARVNNKTTSRTLRSDSEVFLLASSSDWNNWLYNLCSKKHIRILMNISTIKKQQKLFTIISKLAL